jgi:hypothetical protein
MTLLNRNPLLRNGRINNVSAGAVTSCNREELLKTVFSVKSVPRLYNSEPASGNRIGNTDATSEKI